MKNGDLIYQTTFKHCQPTIQASFAASKGRVAVMLLLGDADKKDPDSFDAVDALHNLGWVEETAESELAALREELAHKREALTDAECELAAAEQRNAELQILIDTPHTNDWFEAVRLEAAHQINRWGSEHDAGKQPSDWFWLIGYLSGKALAAAITGNEEKTKHHIISSGAALLNWFRAMTGDSNVMRPGTKPTESGASE